MAKILLVDDTTLSRNILKRILGPEYEYAEASDGASALEQYFLVKPDLVILDLTMPGMRGEEVLEKLRQLDPGSKVIVASADIQKFTRQAVLDLGALAFVNKPFDEEEVRAAVRDALG